VIIQKAVPALLWRISLEELYLSIMADLKKNFNQEGMIGYPLGAFVFTKKLGKSIHNSEKNRKQKEKMRRKITAKKVRKPKTAAKQKSSKTKKK
jgi:hypothetical protein